MLRYFLALAQEGTVSAAAKALHISQPNLSRQLAELEREAGRQLFVRGSRGISLTEAGILLQKRAQEIVDLEESTKVMLGQIDESIAGEVSIGAGESRSMRAIARVVARLHEDHPDVRFRIRSDDAYGITEKLDTNQLDFGILLEPVDLRKYDCLRIYGADEQWGLVVRADGPLGKKKYIHPKDLRGVPLLCSKQMLSGNWFMNWLGYNPSELDIMATFNLVTTPAMMAEDGLACAFSLKGLVRPTDENNLRFVPLEPKVESGLYMVWNRHRAFSRAASKFLLMLYQELDDGRTPRFLHRTQ